ncbi:MAG TPA: hypothetical protein VGG97_19190 [Bryobacteraceae bacterium]
MKILLDENMPHKLRGHLANHETVTAVYAGFGGLKNGFLLTAAEDAGFDVLVTGDLSLHHQQNLSGRMLAIVSLSAISWRIIESHVDKIAAAVNAATPGSLTRVECGVFSRRRRPEDLSLR